MKRSKNFETSLFSRLRQGPACIVATLSLCALAACSGSSSSGPNGNGSPDAAESSGTNGSTTGDAGSSHPGSGSDSGVVAADGGPKGAADAASPIHHGDAGGGGGTSDAGGSTGGEDASTPPPVADAGDDSGDPYAAARAQCVAIINQDRATLSPASPPLKQATLAQEQCVDGQAQADFTANVAHSAFGKCSEWAQDECPGWPGPPSSINTNCLAAMWAEGPPDAGDNHWLNMSNATYTTVACGYYQTPSGDFWTTQDFW